MKQRWQLLFHILKLKKGQMLQWQSYFFHYKNIFFLKNQCFLKWTSYGVGLYLELFFFWNDNGFLLDYLQSLAPVSLFADVWYKTFNKILSEICYKNLKNQSPGFSAKKFFNNSTNIILFKVTCLDLLRNTALLQADPGALSFVHLHLDVLCGDIG